MIETKNLSKIYNPGKFEVKAVNDVNSLFKEGEFTSVVGPSGSGKTTFLNCVGGLDNPTSGDVYIAGENITRLSGSNIIQYRLKNIGFVFQAYNLIPVLSAKENIEMIMLLQGIDEKSRRLRTDELLNQVDLYEMKDRRPSELSGGQQQRVAVARALASKPKFILADEPTGNLDPKKSNSIIETMKEIIEKGKTNDFFIRNEYIYQCKLGESQSSTSSSVSSNNDQAKRKEIIDKLEPFSLHVRVVPTLNQMAGGVLRVDDIHEVDIVDILGRDVVAPDQNLLSSCIAEKVVMVTGAGGSIGSELCRQIIQLQPKKLILFELNEFALYSIDQELNRALTQLKLDSSFEIIPVLGSVVDEVRVRKVCETFNVQTIYHAAAYKHVPLVEQNPCEAIKNNIFGTLSVAQAAISAKVETFVLISTDKAVRPTNTMGATKRFAELILQGLSTDKQHNTRFTMVRFGNVLGSSGSVIPLFREQIARGGPVTVTDSRIIRYFMTIPEAAQLVIQAGAMGLGGDVFVLDMGEPIRIVDLAKRMINLSGLEVLDENHPEGEIKISFTGLRPGEKLYEELLIGDNVSDTVHRRIMRAEEEVIPWAELNDRLERLRLALENDDFESIRGLLKESVSGFVPQCGVRDLLFRANESIH